MKVSAMAAANYDYDLIIIGAGVGGHGAAIHAAECGLKNRDRRRRRDGWDLRQPRVRAVKRC